MKITKEKSIKAWAIMPSFPNNKELERFPFLTENKQFMVYLTKAAAEKDNNKMDEIVVPCKIVFNKDMKKKKKIKEELKKELAKEMFFELQQLKNTMFESSRVPLDASEIAFLDTIEIMQKYLIEKYNFTLRD